MNGEARVPCPRCAELILPDAKVCRYCGYEPGPSLKRFIGADLSGMSSTRRTLNVIGFAILLLIGAIVLIQSLFK